MLNVNVNVGKFVKGVSEIALTTWSMDKLMKVALNGHSAPVILLTEVTLVAGGLIPWVDGFNNLLGAFETEPKNDISKVETTNEEKDEFIKNYEELRKEL